MRALVAIAAGMLGGAWTAVLGLRLEWAPLACLAVLGIGMIVAASTAAERVRPARRAALVLAALAGLVGQAIAPRPPTARPVPSAVARVHGTVTSTRHGRWPSAIVRVERGRTLQEEPLAAGARLRLSGLDVPTGSRVRVLARIGPEVRFANPTPHPRWPSAAPVDGHGRALGRAQIDADAPLPHRLAHRARHRLRRRLEATLRGPARALGRALILGEAGALRRQDRDEVRAAGLSHVLAVSGLHVTLLAGAWVWLLRRLLARSERVALRLDVARLAKALGVPCALGYAALVGDAPSAWRAALTASLAWGLAAAGRRTHPLALTASAALLLGLSRPDDVGRPGFILSIVATAALVSDLPRALGAPGGTSSVSEGDDALGRSAPWVRAGLAVGARTMIATAPLVIWLFGDLPLVGLLANLVAVPLAALVLLPLLALHAIVASLAPGLAPTTAALADPVARAFLAACEVFSELPLGRDLPPPDVWQGIALAAGCAAALALRGWKARSAAALATCALLGAAEVHLRMVEQPTGELRATFLDVGQGDAALVDLPDGGLLAVDAGGAPGGGPDPGQRVLAPLMRARRRARIDVLVLSHPHPDHYGGLEALLAEVEVGEIWDSGQAEVEAPDGAVARLLRSARASGARVRGPDELCGRVHDLGGARARVLWPCPAFDAGYGPNDNSLVLELSYGQRRMLFTGDVEAHAEAALRQEGQLRPVDVLKVAHHGSRTSTDAELLAQLDPSVAIVSAGVANRFEHPHPEVWQRLSDQVDCPYRTDRHGGVVVRTDGRRLVATPTRAGPRCARPAP